MMGIYDYQSIENLLLRLLSLLLGIFTESEKVKYRISLMLANMGWL